MIMNAQLKVEYVKIGVITPVLSATQVMLQAYVMATIIGGLLQILAILTLIMLILNLLNFSTPFLYLLKFILRCCLNCDSACQEEEATFALGDSKCNEMSGKLGDYD